MLITTPVTDIVDACRDKARILNVDWRFFTTVRQFQGRARPVALHGPDGALADLLRTPGEGRVAVVTVGAGDQAAVFGDGMARNAEANGWAGVVIEGAVCDVALIRSRAIGVAARRAFPKFLRDGPAGVLAASVVVGGAPVHEDDWVVADEDGIIVLDPETARGLSA